MWSTRGKERKKGWKLEKEKKGRRREKVETGRQLGGTELVSWRWGGL